MCRDWKCLFNRKYLLLCDSSLKIWLIPWETAVIMNGRAKRFIYKKSEWNIPQIFISLSKWSSVFKELRDFDCSKLVFSKHLSLLFVQFPMFSQPIVSSNKILWNSGLPSRTLLKIHLISALSLLLLFPPKSLSAKLKDLSLILEGGELETFRGGEEETGMNSCPAPQVPQHRQGCG